MNRTAPTCIQQITLILSNTHMECISEGKDESFARHEGHVGC